MGIRRQHQGSCVVWWEDQLKFSYHLAVHGNLNASLVSKITAYVSWVTGSRCVHVMEVTMRDHDSCYGMERKGRWWQLFTAQQIWSVTAPAACFFFLTRNLRRQVSRGQILCDRALMLDLSCSSFWCPWESEKGDTVFPQLLCRSARSDWWARNRKTLHNVLENSLIWVHSPDFPRHLENWVIFNIIFLWVYLRGKSHNYYAK